MKKVFLTIGLLIAIIINAQQPQGDWDKILEISRQMKKTDQHTSYYINLALAMKGELPQKMFSYPQTDETGLLLFRTWDEHNLRYGSDFYYHAGILNEAIRWIYDAYIVHRKGMDYHTLTRLAVWNRENGYEEVSDKYFDLLECTLMYRSFAKRQRKAPLPEHEKTAVAPIEFYIGGRKPVSDMARHYENNPNNRLTLDYILCYLLLSNDPAKFLELFSFCYPLTSSKVLPKAYQEALLFIANMGKADINNYPISPINETRFHKFNELANMNRNAELEKQFGDTWWWYSYRKIKTTQPKSTN